LRRTHPKPSEIASKRCGVSAQQSFAKEHMKRPHPIALSLPGPSRTIQAGSASPAFSRRHMCFAAKNSCTDGFRNCKPSPATLNSTNWLACPSRTNVSIASEVPRRLRSRAAASPPPLLCTSKASSAQATSRPAACSCLNSAVSRRLAESRLCRQSSKMRWNTPVRSKVLPWARTTSPSKCAAKSGVRASSLYCRSANTSWAVDRTAASK